MPHLMCAGQTGAGKSVLMRTVLRLLPRQGGMIKILGEDYDSLAEPERNKLDMRLGVLFQQGALFSSLTVKENIQVPMREHLELPQAMISDCGSSGLTRTGTVLPGWKLPITKRLTTCVRVAW